MAGLLTSVGDDKDKAAVYLADCRKLGITVLPPDVNESGLNFASVGEDIRYGLGAVRNVGANVVASLINSRTDKGKFIDFSDYLNKIDIGAVQQEGHRVADQGRRVRLARAIRARACSWCTPTPSIRCSGTKKAEAMGQFDLFGGADTATDAVFTIKVPDEEWDDKHKLALEREMLGLYVSGHPLNGVAHLLTAQVDTADPGDPRRRRPQRRPGARRRNPGRGEPARQQERNALGVSAIGRSHRRHRGDVLPADLLELRRGESPTTPWCWSAPRCESRTTGSR